MVAIVVAVVAFILIGGAGILLAGASPGIGPSDFSMLRVASVAPGSVGCASTAGEVCYSATVVAYFPGLTLREFDFELANGTDGFTTSGAIAPRANLGAGAHVFALANGSHIIGVWEYAHSEWLSGGDRSVADGANLTVVLDADLTSNATFESAWFEVILTAPFGGSVGGSVQGLGPAKRN